MGKHAIATTRAAILSAVVVIAIASNQQSSVVVIRRIESRQESGERQAIKADGDLDQGHGTSQTQAVRRGISIDHERG